MLEQCKNKQLVDLCHPEKLEVDLQELTNVQYPIDYALPYQHSMIQGLADEREKILIKGYNG